MNNKFMFALIALLLATGLFAQGTAGTSSKYEYRHFIDMPTTGVLNKGYVGVAVKNLPDGNVIGGIEAGVFENFSFGLSYGGANIIGSGKIDWYETPAFNVRYRVLDETTNAPSVSIGFDSQGKGAWVDSSDRYEIKSPGFFASTSKTFDFLGYVVLSGTMNYSFENDDDKDLNFGIGVEKTVGKFVSVYLEYDFAMNDNSDKALGDGDGYLNAGVRWAVGNGFTIGFDLRDLLENKKLNGTQADRALFVEYIQPIF